MTRSEAQEIVKILKVGQKVKINKDLCDGISGVMPVMKEYCDKMVEITTIGNCSVRIQRRR